MNPMLRIESPQFLEDHKREWTETYISGKAFAWHDKQKELLKALKSMTLSHCAFCDDVLVPLGSDEGEIEHFKPKDKYKELAFEWTNLYPICRRCNGTKTNKFEETLLQPDENEYQFSTWFQLDSDFKLKPRKLGNPNWKRAEISINLYGLNKEGTLSRREFEFDKIQNGEYKNSDYQPFRFMVKK